jgi:RNA polymerase primary sigma factor
MKIAFQDKVSGVEKKSNGRVTRVRAAKKCLPRGWRPAKTVAPETALRITPEIVDVVPTAPKESLSGDSLQLYLNEIGQVKLLTPEEELSLAKQVKRGNKKARERMITANLRLVVRIARDYENLGLPLLDLINEGNIGLMKGVERYDPTKGAKLSY